MHNKLYVLLSVLTLNGHLIGSEGKLRTGHSVDAIAAAEASEKTSSGPLAYAIAGNAPTTSTAQFGILDSGTGAFHGIADLPNSGQGIARDRQGKIYIVDSTNNLVRVIIGNGKTQLIGSTGVSTPSPLGSLSVDVFASLATGELFLMDYSNNLYSVNPDTGAATLIGATGIPAIVSPLYSSSLSADCKYLYFTIDEVDQNLDPLIPPSLYRIDPTTGAATYIGGTQGLLSGSGFIGGSLYGFSIDEQALFGGTRSPHVFRVNTASGAANLVSDLNVSIVGGATAINGGEAGHCKVPSK